MRRGLPLVTVLLAGAWPIAAAVGAAPPGATAQCRDGSYSYSQHHSGTCSHHGGVAVWLDGSAIHAAPSGADPGTTVLLARRTRTSGCKLAANPDRRCSPGAYYRNLTRSVICSPTFRTSTYRNVPTAEKHADEQEYGLTPKPYGSSLEIDHIVSLELGGSNNLANLFPEDAGLGPGYRAKDRLENRLHDLVCSGKISLRSAQQQIAANWQALYQKVFGSPA